MTKSYNILAAYGNFNFSTLRVRKHEVKSASDIKYDFTMNPTTPTTSLPKDPIQRVCVFIYLNLKYNCVYLSFWIYSCIALVIPQTTALKIQLIVKVIQIVYLFINGQIMVTAMISH